MTSKISLFISIIISLLILTSCQQNNNIIPASESPSTISEPPVSQSSSQSKEQTEPQSNSTQESQASPEKSSSSSSEPNPGSHSYSQQSSSSSQQPVKEKPLPAESSSPENVEQPQKVSVSAPKPSNNCTYIPKDEKEVIRLFNEERVALGLNELKYDLNLTTAARIRSHEMVTAGTFEHKRPDGRNWDSVLKVDVPLKMGEWGENLCMYEAPEGNEFTAFDWFTEWKNSPAHYENMIRNSFTHVGIGIYKKINDDGTTTTIATALFCKY